MPINVAKLDAELKSAGIPIDGCSSNGRVDFRPEATEAQRLQAEAIVAAHNPADTRQQRFAKLGVTELFVADFLERRKGVLAPAWAKARLDEFQQTLEASGDA